MTHSSLRLRLLAGWAIFIALIVQVAGLGLGYLFERSITRRTELELEADLRQLRRGMEVDEDGHVRIARAPTDPQFDIEYGGRYWQIAEGGSVIVRSASLGDYTLPLPKGFVPAAETKQAWIEGPEKQLLFGVVRTHALESPEAGPPRTLVITTAVDGAEIRQDTAKFSSDLFSSLIGLALLLMLGAFAQVTIGLRPLNSLRSSVAEVREGRKRLIAGPFPDEVMPLVSETNALLAAQETALRNARQRAGDLAHGLKTPLAIMATKSRQVRRAGEIQASDDIDRQIDLMSRHIERELARARARGNERAVLIDVDVAALLRQLVSAIQALPRDPPLDWTTTVPERLPVAVDPDDFNNLAGNLVENAHKWARSRVIVSAAHTHDGFVLSVVDDGPGIPCDQIARVLERGGRADTSVAGSGLGLAIVSDLAESYGGRLELAKVEPHGLTARVWLPDGPRPA